MLGAMIGDMVGAPFEFDRSPKVKDFGPLFTEKSRFTDDTVMTVAVAEALLDAGRDADEKTVKAYVIKQMQSRGKKYPDAGYGGSFIYWLYEKPAHPYGSFGNGSAMRVSSAGWLYDSIERTREVARWTAEVSHNHPEGIRGAEAAASVIYLARTGHTKREIRDYVIREFHYDLSRSCDEIRPGYHHDESCQHTVPEAITAFLEGNSFEDVLRTAVSLGGDCDTLSDIACAMAEGMYAIPDSIKAEVRKREPAEFLETADRFYQEAWARQPSLEGNELIEKTIAAFHETPDQAHLTNVLTAFRLQADLDGRLLVAVERTGAVLLPGQAAAFRFRTVQDEEGKTWWAAFTSEAQKDKGEMTSVFNTTIHGVLKGFLAGNGGAEGIIVNPWGKPMKLSEKLIRMIEM